MKRNQRNENEEKFGIAEWGAFIMKAVNQGDDYYYDPNDKKTQKAVWYSLIFDVLMSLIFRTSPPTYTLTDKLLGRKEDPKVAYVLFGITVVVILIAYAVKYIK